MAHGTSVTVSDPAGLIRALEASGRFRRDTRLGGILHPGEISFRENSPSNSLHVTIVGNRVRAHVDEVSPLDCESHGSRQYSLSRVVVHNLAVLVEDLGRRARGLHGRQRCTLECEAVWVDEDPAPEGEGTGAGRDVSFVPFGIVDQAIHLLDTEPSPWSIQLEVRVTGHLDETRLRDAVSHALARHPLARAREVSSGGWRSRHQWEIPPGPGVDVDPVHVVECVDDRSLATARAELQSTPIPLEQSPPLRLWLARHPRGDVVMLSVSHAAMDGFGALRVLESVARAYAGQADPAPAVELTEARALPAHLDRTGLSTRVRRYLALADKLRDVVVPTARLAPDGEDDDAGYGFHHVALSRSRTRSLTELDHAGTVNDVLLAALHLAIAEWNADHGTPAERIGVLVPANLRPAQWRGDMAGNFTLPARVATTATNRSTPAAALAAVTRCTRRKKSVGMGTALLELLSRTQSLPLWAKRATVALLPATGNRLVDTAMLSNLGRLDDPPSFGPDAGRVTEAWFSPPGRMPLGLTVGVVTVSGRLHLVFRYQHRLFGPGAARRFANGYLAQLERLVADEPNIRAAHPVRRLSA
ncbi:MAG: condensation domain-containing protein [Actinomycetota bacterium]|nr:condensation domain-containing protein [Actinomycetota bacterium]